MIDLTEDGDNFVLTSSLPHGAGSRVVLSAEDLLKLSQSSHLWQQRALSRFHPKSGDVSAVFATPTKQIEIHIDALGENILLGLVGSNETKVTYEIARPLALELSQKLPSYVYDLGKKGASQ